MNLPIANTRLDAFRHQALEFAGIGLYQYSFEGIVLAIDRGALSIFDLEEIFPDPRLVEGKSIGELIRYTYPPGTLREKVRAYGHVRNLELKLITLTGFTKWISHDANIVKDVLTGEDVIQVIVQDVTARRQAEDALRQAYAEMEIQVEARTASEREQRIMAEGLRDIVSVINSTLQLDEVLDRILSEIQKVVPHDCADIMLINDNTIQVVRDSDSKIRKITGPKSVRTLSISEFPVAKQMINTRKAIIIEDTSNHPEWIIISKNCKKIRSCLGAPIQHGGEMIGFINLYSHRTKFFKENQAEGLQAFADQAAIAIGNARLYTQAQELASLEERQRLARDLHDSVSQLLWTAVLISYILPGNLEANPEEGQRNIAQLQRLTQGALAEMRSLLLELRPSALEEALLGDLLQQLSQSVMSRKDVDIRVTIDGDIAVPNQIKIGLYRIAQEALNNAAKHARATEIDINLSVFTERIELTICDNGRGFDKQHDRKGFGLSIMRERADNIGASLIINSGVGMGTNIKIVWPSGNPSKGKISNDKS